MPGSGQVDGGGVRTHNGIRLGRKTGILPSVAAWMDLESVQTEVSRTEKDKYHIMPLTCAI